MGGEATNHRGVAAMKRPTPSRDVDGKYPGVSARALDDMVGIVERAGVRFDEPTREACRQEIWNQFADIISIKVNEVPRAWMRETPIAHSEKKAAERIVAQATKMANDMRSIVDGADLFRTDQHLRQLSDIADFYGGVAARPSRRQAPRPDSRRRYCADATVSIMRQFGRPLTSRRGSPLCKLAEAMHFACYRIPSGNMEHYCRAAVTRAKLRAE